MRVSWMKHDPEQRFTLRNKTFTDYICAGFPKSVFQVKDQLLFNLRTKNTATSIKH